MATASDKPATAMDHAVAAKDDTVSRALALLLAIAGNSVGMAWALGWSSVATPGDFITLLMTLIGFVVGTLVGAVVGYVVGIPFDRMRG